MFNHSTLYLMKIKSFTIVVQSLKCYWVKFLRPTCSNHYNLGKFEFPTSPCSFDPKKEKPAHAHTSSWVKPNLFSRMHYPLRLYSPVSISVRSQPSDPKTTRKETVRSRFSQKPQLSLPLLHPTI